MRNIGDQYWFFVAIPCGESFSGKFSYSPLKLSLKKSLTETL
jgi:hypothetical protein